ncbi:MAG: hypothetical protein K6G33_01045 [Ruminococcus sp.]|uniref:hypothetical protein n=1 Tax=Ruminococcus sp. TaxID=41978 RepID=UPI0025FC592F|nr:hypothetical protein [Ruminococcus sp.]MCR5599320.1 hypothetical protein [Ruminococcus sp.]
MIVMKRVLAGLASLALMCSSNSAGFTAIAEDNVKVGGDEVITQTDKELKIREEDERRREEENRKRAEERFDDARKRFIESVRLEALIDNNWCNTTRNWNVELNADTYDDFEYRYNVRFFYKIKDKDNNKDIDWGSIADAVEGSEKFDYNFGRTYPFEMLFQGKDIVEGEHYIKLWAVVECEIIDKAGNIVRVEKEISSDERQYKYDRTSPDRFKLKVDIKENDINIISENDLKDNYSNNLKVYYTLDKPKCSDIEELKKISERKETSITNNNGKKNFKINAYEAYGHHLIVYVVDEAGNLVSDSMLAYNQYDPSKDSLLIRVDGLDEGNWKKNIEWKPVNFNTDDIELYYNTSDKNDEKEWKSKEKIKWDYKWGKDDLNKQIPEGERYVHFWLKYKDDFIAERTLKYKFDQTRPSAFDVEKYYNYESNIWEFRNVDSIEEYLSGFNSLSCLGEITDNNGRVTNTIDFSGKLIINEKDGKLNFVLPIDGDLEEFLKEKGNDNKGNPIFYPLHFEVTDKAGNAIGKRYSYDDKVSPVITVPSKVVSGKIDIDKNIISDVSEKKADKFGDVKTGENVSRIYACSGDYIRVTFKEKNPYRVKLNINGKIYNNDITNFFYFKPSIEKQEKLAFVKHGESEISSDDDIYDCYIPLSKCQDLKKGKVNTIKIEAWDYHNPSVIEDGLAKKSDEVEFYYECEKPEIEDVSISDTVSINGILYHIGNSKINVSANISDNYGLRNYSITLVEEKTAKVTKIVSGTVPKTQTTITVTSKNDAGENVSTAKTITVPQKTYKVEGSFNNSKFEDGKYKLIIRTEDIAGNFKEEERTLYFDSVAPAIKGNFKYNYEKAVLNFLSFGIFGNKTVNIEVEIEDEGIGLDESSLKLLWGGKVIIGKRKDKSTDNVYVFSNLPVNNVGEPTITIKDIVGNERVYYFTTDENDNLSQNLDKSTLLELENEKPAAKIVLPEEGQYIIDKEIWYAESVNVTASASDTKSGLRRVDYKEETLNVDGNYDTKQQLPEFIKDDKKYFSEKYDHIIEEEGHYRLTVEALDNAGNYASDDKNTEADRIKTIHIDKADPKVVKIELNDMNGEEVAPENDRYGLFFNEDTIVKVYVDDEKDENDNNIKRVSSGINYVNLYMLDAEGNKSVTTVFSDEEDYHKADEENETAYAEFTVKKGFKGKIWVLAADKVAAYVPDKEKPDAEMPVEFRHTSGYRFIDGTIVEGRELHETVSDITITEDIPTDKRDYDDIPLYKENIPLTVNVKDTFSGINRIEWSIRNDNKSGVITVDDFGNIVSDSELAAVVTESDSPDKAAILTDKNIVTEFSFRITVESDTNNNEVFVKLIDNAGNDSYITKQYSIDKTVPVISASLSNNSASNGRYFNTEQVVSISIQERNFNASDVELTLSRYDESTRSWSRSEQPVSSWNVSGEGDEAVHTTSFTISNDGNYSFDVSFSDMAGNMAESFSQSDFVIDRTPPVLKTNFDEFKSGRNGNYYGSDSLNKTARITVTEHNFSSEGANVVILKKDPGSEHNTSSMISTSAYGWKDNGDEHILEIPFKEGDDGVYLIKVTPVDLASNATASQSTQVFEIDFTKPVISERNGEYVQDDPKSYEKLEIYNEKNKAEEGFVPSVGFSDVNFDHLVYDITVYTPVYKNGKELELTKVDKQTKQVVVDANTFEQGKITEEKVFSLPEFKKDGVYSVNITAVDKAGNKSRLCKNTFVMMNNTDVLAYISNSNKANGEGWYSLQKDEYTPISKRPDSFSDLDITVFAQTGSNTRIILRDENGVAKDTGITAENSSDMYAVGVYNYRLPKEYFIDNYPEGTNKDLYLWAENTYNDESSHITLGWIRIDAVAPTCHIPSDLKKNNFFVKNTKTFKLTGISESLDKSKCMVYDNGQAVPQDKFEYSDFGDTLTYTLDKGWHDLSFVLVDEAGNAFTIKEVSFIQVGLLYCLWFRILCGVAAAGLILAVVLFIRKKLANR